MTALPHPATHPSTHPRAAADGRAAITGLAHPAAEDEGKAAAGRPRPCPRCVRLTARISSEADHAQQVAASPAFAAHVSDVMVQRLADAVTDWRVHLLGDHSEDSDQIPRLALSSFA
ncbi:hypothetical protein BIV57_11210 [Mangrovactinospora gilvigrisea]|uniref:Uncharacterized protein n=1 Tax=Mangrovactinospora gilvigrisea TaxID=1428644 RepID=A0A1J7CCH4_9ACTN|nr:hypothetical protein [Mangrovactinospora gilvigrisea]OIV37378.1 hypothetical protein BIV57_11210 [Mangrovactinospora gilvigrisea]